MPTQLTRGTIESVEVKVVDVTGATTDLSTSDPHFNVFDDEDTLVITNEAATVDGMVIHCLVDTTSFDSTKTRFRLLVTFTLADETPLLGPFPIYIVEQ